MTLPVWVTAAAKAALQVLLGEPFEPEQQLSQGSDQLSMQVPVCSAAPLSQERPWASAVVIQGLVLT